MIQWFRRCKRRIGIICHWLPIIWNDYDFDYSNILIVLQHKIKRTRIDIENASRHVGYERNVKNMRIAELLIDRLNNNSYILQKDELCTCDPDAQRWSEDGVWINPFCDQCIKFTIPKKCNMENGEWDYLFDHMKKHMRKWWD